MKSNEAAEGNENACFSAHFSGKTGTSTGADNGRAVCLLPSPGEAFSRSQAGLPAWLPPQEHLPSDFFASGCTDFPRHTLPNTPVSDAAHRCAPVWAVHLSRILYMLTAHLSICYASLTLSRRFAIILMEETAFVDFIRFLCISFRTQGAIFLAPAACLPVTNPINKLRWGCEAVQRAIAKPSGRLRRGETPAIKKLTTEKAPFPQKKKAPLFGALCRTFPP